MPDRERVSNLIAYVERREFLEAMREFYHEEAALQENNELPRIGLTTNIEHERCFLEAVKTFHEVRARSFLVDGDRAAIRWTIDVTTIDGRRMWRDEIAYQYWEGDKIVCEQYFYDASAPANSAYSASNVR